MTIEKALHILKNHNPEPLPGDVQGALNEIFDEAVIKAEKQAK